MDSEAPYNIERFTTEYHPAEDRIRFLVTDAKGSVQLLWLTRRLINRLILAVVECLEKETESKPESEILQSFSQQSATSKISPEEQVVGEIDTESWLVTHIDLTPSQQVVKLVFYDKNEHRARLNFSRIKLRQWMSILSEMYRRAGWLESIWPDWLDPQSNQSTSDKPQVH